MGDRPRVGGQPTMRVNSNESDSSERLEDAEELLDKVFVILKPICQPSNLNVKHIKCSTQPFVSVSCDVTEPAPRPGVFFPTLQLIVTVEQDTLHLQLFHRQSLVFRAGAVENLQEHFSNPDQYLGLLTVLSSYVSELETSRYTPCPGAFTEDGLHRLGQVDVKDVLIERDCLNSIVYRARQCPYLIKKTDELEGKLFTCSYCLLLRSSNSDEKSQAEDKEMAEELEFTEGRELQIDEESNEMDPTVMLSQCLEVSMDDGEEEVNTCEQNFKNYQQSSNNPSKNSHVISNESILRQIKPKMSYKKLIMLAIEDSQYKMLKLSDIYDWILLRYPMFASNRTGFQNSIRHNLSLNKVFIKVDSPGLSSGGKGNYWTINPKFDPNQGPTLNRNNPAKKVPDFLQNHSPGTNGFKPTIDKDGMKPNTVCKSVFLDLKTKMEERVAGEQVRPELTITSVPAEPDRHPSNGVSRLDSLLQEKLKSLKAEPVTSPLPQPPVDYSGAKPSFSYKELIMLSIFCDPARQMCLNDIYLTIKHYFPYYQLKSIGVTWQNSIRHNLSLNRCFRRLSSGPRNPAGHLATKGGNWTFDTADETWKKLMTTPAKWRVLNIGQAGRGELVQLCHLLAARQPDFARYVQPKLELAGGENSARPEPVPVLSPPPQPIKNELMC